MDADDVVAQHFDRLARAFHQDYIWHREAEGDTPATNSSMVPWDDLPDTLKQSNRAQVEHIPDKLAAIECRLESPGQPHSEAEAFAFTQGEIERLAQMEHDRWWVERVIDGWVYDPGPKDADRKRSPYLVPWSELTEDIKENDRTPVRAIPTLATLAGLEIVRSGNVGGLTEKEHAWHRTQVEQYDGLSDTYREYAEKLEAELRTIARAHAPLALITSRAKSVASFADKALRKRHAHDDPVHQFTDLCGARVILRTRSEVDEFSRVIEASFTIDRDNSDDTSTRLDAQKFGYRSVHKILSFSDGDLGISKPGAPYPLRAELQIRTVAEHAYADFAHDLTYKGAFQLPRFWERELALVAAQVETIDETLVRVEDGLRQLQDNFGAYLDRDEMRREIETLETILEFDATNASLASRIGRLALARGDSAKAVEVLDRFREQQKLAPEQLDTMTATVIRDLGVALCEHYGDGSNPGEYRRGTYYLERAASALTAAADRADALTSLGDATRRDLTAATQHYRAAFEADPSDVRALTRYLECEIARGDVAIVPLLKPAIHAALTRCDAQVEVGVNLPHALAAMGELLLLQGRSNDSLHAYAKAVRAATARFLVEEMLESLDLLGRAEASLDGYQSAHRLVLLGRGHAFRSTQAG